MASEQVERVSEAEARKIAAGFAPPNASPMGIFAATGEITSRMARIAEQRLRGEDKAHRTTPGHPLHRMYLYVAGESQ